MCPCVHVSMYAFLLRSVFRTVVVFEMDHHNMNAHGLVSGNPDCKYPFLKVQSILLIKVLERLIDRK